MSNKSYFFNTHTRPLFATDVKTNTCFDSQRANRDLSFDNPCDYINAEICGCIRWGSEFQPCHQILCHIIVSQKSACNRQTAFCFLRNFKSGQNTVKKVNVIHAVHILSPQNLKGDYHLQKSDRGKFLIMI